MLRALVEGGVEEVGLRRWSLPVLAALGGGRRFSELKTLLPGVTSRSLALVLQELGAAGLVERRVEESFPPRTWYRPTRPGRALRLRAVRLADALTA
jgi:DNA-binding HxlR family transcriptional regulator